MKILKRFYLGLILFFLYIPIVVLIVQSFNAGKSRAKWEGFSFHWYEELFHDPNIMNALVVTLSIAVLAALFSTILGTFAEYRYVIKRLLALSELFDLTLFNQITRYSDNVIVFQVA